MKNTTSIICLWWHWTNCQWCWVCSPNRERSWKLRTIETSGWFLTLEMHTAVDTGAFSVAFRNKSPCVCVILVHWRPAHLWHNNKPIFKPLKHPTAPPHHHPVTHFAQTISFIYVPQKSLSSHCCPTDGQRSDCSGTPLWFGGNTVAPHFETPPRAVYPW